MGTKGNKKKKTHGRSIKEDEVKRLRIEEIFKQLELEKKPESTDYARTENKTVTPANPSNSLEIHTIYIYPRPRNESASPRSSLKELYEWSKRNLVPKITDKPVIELSPLRERGLVPVVNAQPTTRERAEY